MKNAFDFLKIVDIYGHDVKFSINGQGSSQTILGGLLSILSAVAIITMGCLFAQDFFFRLNPSVSKIDYLLMNHINFTATVESLPIAVDYEGDNLSGFFIITAHYLLYNPNNDAYAIKKNVQLHNCTKADFPKIDQNLYNKRLPKGSLCLDDYNFNIVGTYTDDMIGILKITIDECDNTIYECSDESDIKEEINSNSYFTLTLGNSVLDPSNYSFPIQQYLQTNYISSSVNINKYVEIFIKEEVLETDDGIVFKTNKTKSAFAYYNERNSFHQSMTSNLLAEFTIVSSNSVSRTKRIYAKGQNVLAEVGGIVSIILTIAPFITKILAEVRTEEAILNKIVHFDFEDKTSLLKHLRKIDTQQLNHNDKKSLNGTSYVTSLNNFNGKDIHIDKQQPRKIQEQEVKHNNTKVMIINKKERTESNRNLTGLEPRVYHVAEFSRRKRLSQNDMIESQLDSKVLEIPIDLPTTSNPTSPNIANHPLDQAEIIKSIDTISTWKTNVKNLLYFNCCEVICIKLFCCCKMNPRLHIKYTLYNKQLSLINNYLEVTNLFQRLEDIDKMKYVLFDPYQLAALKLLNVEYCSIDDTKVQNGLLKKMRATNDNNDEQIKNNCIYYLSNNSIDNQEALSYDKTINKRIDMLLKDKIDMIMK